MGYLTDFRFLLVAINGNFYKVRIQCHKTSGHFLLLLCGQLLMSSLYVFTIGSQGFGPVNAYSCANFLQYSDNVALWTTSMSLGREGSHLAWLARAWVLGPFLAYLEIFSEGKREVLISHSRSVDLHNDLASLQNECTQALWKYLMPIPAKQEPKALGSGQGTLPASWARLGDSFIFLGLKFLGLKGWFERHYSGVEVLRKPAWARVESSFLRPPNCPAEGGIHRAVAWSDWSILKWTLQENGDVQGNWVSWEPVITSVLRVVDRHLYFRPKWGNFWVMMSFGQFNISTISWSLAWPFGWIRGECLGSSLMV